MKSFLTILVVTMFIGCSGGGGSGGNACSDLSLKIVGGSHCRFERSPVVLIVPVDASGEHIVPLGACTGTMVTVNDVLTAAHCLTQPVARGATDIVVFAGETAYPIVKLAIHPFYRGETLSPFDVAMITIDGILDISPVPLQLGVNIAEGQSITVFGYGVDGEGKSAKELGLSALKAARMKIGGIAGGVFGAFFDDTKTSVCSGDSGGPVTQTIGGVTGIVGVSSFSIDGCKSGSLSGFADMQIVGNVDFVLGYAPDIAIM